MLSFYQSLFGKNLYIFPFERFASNRLGFLSDFIKIFKLDIDLEELDLEPKNKRLNTPSYKKWRNRLRIPEKLSVSNITGGRLNHESIFKRRKCPEEILGNKNSDYIKQYYKESNQTLIDLFGLKDIREFEYPLDPVQ